MNFTLDAKSNHLNYSRKYLPIMNDIKKNNILLHLKTANNIQDNVLKDKTVEIDGCADITKILNIKSDLPCKKVYIKSITLELECR